MKNAERIIMTLLLTDAKVITKLKLVKLLFLLNRTGINGVYDFLPYKYGPFSFQLYRDITKLSQEGWIEDDRLAINADKKVAALEEARKLPADMRDTVLDIYTSYGRLTDNDLLNTVYSKYPEFTFKSELNKTATSSPKALLSIYTIGYEGASIDLFLNALLQKGIATLIDVRSNPVSRKWGFAKSTLSNLCEKTGIAYVHVPELGISSEKREGLATRDDYNALLDEYEKNIFADGKDKIKDALSLIEKAPSVLVCMEADVQMCHRGRLAKKMSEMTQLPIVHLKVK